MVAVVIEEVEEKAESGHEQSVSTYLRSSFSSIMEG